jgi:hypothetical protein
MTRVRAKQLGYYDHLRRKEGAEFTIAKPEHFSERWMEKIDPASTAAPATQLPQPWPQKLRDGF